MLFFIFLFWWESQLILVVSWPTWEETSAAIVASQMGLWAYLGDFLFLANWCRSVQPTLDLTISSLVVPGSWPWAGKHAKKPLSHMVSAPGFCLGPCPDFPSWGTVTYRMQEIFNSQLGFGDWLVYLVNGKCATVMGFSVKIQMPVEDDWAVVMLMFTSWGIWSSYEPIDYGSHRVVTHSVHILSGHGYTTAD